MWNPTTRRQYSRNQPRYETDLTDAEWAVIAATDRLRFSISALNDSNCASLASSGLTSVTLFNAIPWLSTSWGFDPVVVRHLHLPSIIVRH